MTEGVFGPVVLTELELALLEEAHLRVLGETPSEQDVEEQPGARQEALASLTARGLLDAEGQLDEDEPVAALVGAALDLRLVSAAVLVVDRVMGPAQDGGQDHHASRVLHLSEHGLCVEDVDPAGFHALALSSSTTSAVAAVVEFLVPPDAVDGEGEVLAVDPSPQEMLRLLGRPTVLGELALVWTAEAGPRGPERHLLALGPGGCFVSTRPSPGPGTAAVAGAPAEPPPGSAPEDGMRFRPVPVGWLGSWVAGVVGVEEATGDARWG